MISIIIYVHNAKNNLYISLNSLLKQTYQNFEVICIDATLTDSSLEILEYFSNKDKRIKILKNERKTDLKYWKLYGMNNIHGDYVTFLKVDKWLNFNTLEIVNNKIKKEQADIIIFNKKGFEPDLDKINISNIPENIFYSTSFLNKINSNIQLNQPKISVINQKLFYDIQDFRINETTSEIKIKKLSEEILTLKNDNNYLISNLNNLKTNVQKLKEDNLILQKELGKYKKPKILDKLIKKEYSKLTIAIKSPHPKGTKHWGDLFFSIALKKAFEKLGFNVIIQERERWYEEKEIDIAFVLRGLTNYEPNYSNFNIMWNISHPKDIELEEYEKYDQVFISSKKYANKIKNKVNTNVAPLLQCTDPQVFYPEVDENIKDEILFVGVSRGVYREIIKDVLKTKHDISIYGMDWEKFIDKKYIKGQFIPNEELHKYYSSCKILLNDHWEDMKNEDFPSNRLFDALACGAFVISDNIPSANTLFKGSIITYDNVDDLNEKINYYLSNENKRTNLAKKGRKIVLENHTFDNRVQEILDTLKKIKI